MKPFLKYALLSCIVSMFLFDNSAMAQRRVFTRPNPLASPTTSRVADQGGTKQVVNQDSAKLGDNTPLAVLEREAEKDNPEALLYLGVRYFQGVKGCPVNQEKAIELLQRGSQFADTDSPAAQFCRAFCYLGGWGVRQNQTEAVRWMRKAAEQGFADAQDQLGLLYVQGQGVPKDMTEAIKWIRLAAEQGHTEAQGRLGACYAAGDGVRQDMAEAIRWTRKAAEQGLAEAQFTLGLYYVRGEGVRKNFTEAVKWFRLGAAQGHAGAQNSLGVCYVHGEGVRKDVPEGVKWYRLSAEQGYAEAQANLGGCYAQGLGVPKNLTEAEKWLRLSAEQGHPAGQHNLRILLQGGGDRNDSRPDYRPFGSSVDPTSGHTSQGTSSSTSNDTGRVTQVNLKDKDVFFEYVNVFLPPATDSSHWPPVGLPQGTTGWSNWRQGNKQVHEIIQNTSGALDLRTPEKRAVQYRVDNKGWYQIKFQFLNADNWFGAEINARIKPDGSIEYRKASNDLPLWPPVETPPGTTGWSDWRQGDRRVHEIIQKTVGTLDMRAVQYRVDKDGWYQIKFQFLNAGNWFGMEINARIKPDGSLEHRKF